MLGCTKEVTIAEETAVTVTIPPGTQHSDTIIVPGYGVPNASKTTIGDLLVEVRVLVPTKLHKQDESILLALQSKYKA